MLRACASARAAHHVSHSAVTNGKGDYLPWVRRHVISGRENARSFVGIKSLWKTLLFHWRLLNESERTLARASVPEFLFGN